MTRILLVDDHALFREGIRALLRPYPDLQVVGEASDGAEALALLEELRPDVVLLDIAMPGMGGLETAPEIARRSPGTRILILSQYDNKEYVHRFLRLGVSGYVLKKAAGTELVAAIRATARGESFLDPSVAGTVIQGFLGGGGEPAGHEALTERERQVLTLIAQGRTSKEIAEALTIAVKTVMAHRANLMEKLDLHNRTDLIRFAIRTGLITAE